MVHFVPERIESASLSMIHDCTKVCITPPLLQMHSCVSRDFGKGVSTYKLLLINFAPDTHNITQFSYKEDKDPAAGESNKIYTYNLTVP